MSIKIEENQEVEDKAREAIGNLGRGSFEVVEPEDDGEAASTADFTVGGEGFYVSRVIIEVRRVKAPGSDDADD